MFKLEPDVGSQTLIQRAKSSGKKVGADLIVANRLNPYQAFIIGRNGSQISANSKQELVKKLVKALA